MEKIPVRSINTTQSGPGGTEGFRIRDIKAVLGGKDMVQELHRHAFYHLLVLEKGKGRHEIDFNSYDIGDHSVFFMRPGQIHQLSLKVGSTGYLVEFNGNFYHPREKASNQLLRKASGTNHFRFDAAGFKQVFPILHCIFREHAGRLERYDEVIKFNLSIFLVELARQNSKTPSSGTNTYVQERVDELLQLLETNVFSHKKVSDYADMLNLSTYQLNTITRSALGKTCSELINEHIILESKRNLLATSSQIGQVAYDLGYEDVSYFIRFFKKHTGHTPETFRRNFK